MVSFGIADYLVLLCVLLTLSAVGLHFRHSGGRQSSTEEYLLGNRNQRIIPVAVSLVANHMSGIAILGIPGEVYLRGAVYSLVNLSLFIVIPITAHLVLPVFFKVGSSSAYEYLELRFGRRVRTLAALLYPLQSVLFSAVVLCAPALALETLTGLPANLSILIVGSVCTFYSTVGGIKAVIITDIFQFILSNLAVWSIILATYFDEMTFTNVWKTAAEGGRLNFSNFSLDPTERHTWWSLVIGATFTYLGTYAVHQAQVQRYMTLKDHETAMKAIYISLPLTITFSLSLSFAGLCIYSKYHECDPLKSGTISIQDQLVPLFVEQVLGGVPGLSGFLVAGVFSASLSSISANLHSLATISVQDFLRPVYFSFKKADLSEKQSLLLSKFLVVCYGCLLMFMASMARMITGILQTGLVLVGLVGGPMVALYTLGLFVPSANESGAVAVLLSGTVVSMWLSFGGPKPPVKNLPTNTSKCSSNTTFTFIPVTHENVIGSRSEEYFYFYKLSYWWTVVVSCIFALLVGYLTSCLTFAQVKKLDADLFSPPVAARLKNCSLKTHQRKTQEPLNIECQLNMSSL